MASTAQSIHYSFDMRSPVLTNVLPLDIQYPRVSSGNQVSDQTGGFPLNIPGGIDYDPSNTILGLSWQNWWAINGGKRSAIQEQYPGFGYILYDDMDDASSFDLATASGMRLGGRGSFMLGRSGSGASVTTNAIALSGAAPDEAFVWLDGGHYVDSLDAGTVDPTAYNDPKTGRCQRYFMSLAVGPLCIIDVSFNGGATWLVDVGMGTLISVPPGDQGTSFKMRLTRRNVSAHVRRVLILGWGLVY